LEFAGSLFLIQVIDDVGQNPAQFLAERSQMHEAINIQLRRLQLGNLGYELIDFSLPAVEVGFVLQEILGVANYQQFQCFSSAGPRGFDSFNLGSSEAISSCDLTAWCACPSRVSTRAPSSS
jgi:hypothetical protein